MDLGPGGGIGERSAIGERGEDLVLDGRDGLGQHKFHFRLECSREIG